MTFHLPGRMLFHSRKPVKAVCRRTRLIFSAELRVSASGMWWRWGAGSEHFANSHRTAPAFTAWGLGPGGRDKEKKCCGQEEGPETWSQSSFPTLLFLNQQYPNISLLTASSWQFLMPISCYLGFFLVFVFEPLKCFPFSVMSKFSPGFQRAVAIQEPEGHKRVPERT